MRKVVRHLLIDAAAIVSLAGCVAVIPPPEQNYPTELQHRIPDADDEVIEASRTEPLWRAPCPRDNFAVARMQSA